MPELDVRTTKYSPKTEAKRGGETTSPYPLIFFKEALGYNIVLTSDEKTATKVADSVIGKLIQDEKKVATLYYKEGYNVEAISEDLSISTDEVNRILKAIKKKITHLSYNGEMEQHIAVAKPNSTNAMEKLKELVGIKD
jgi:DNA-binding transcriptional regulator LsrR (DeoR family)